MEIAIIMQVLHKSVKEAQIFYGVFNKKLIQYRILKQKCTIL